MLENSWFCHVPSGEGRTCVHECTWVINDLGKDSSTHTGADDICSAGRIVARALSGVAAARRVDSEPYAWNDSIDGFPRR